MLKLLDEGCLEFLCFPFERSKDEFLVFLDELEKTARIFLHSAQSLPKRFDVSLSVRN